MEEKNDFVFTNNEGRLEIISPFSYFRGKHNANTLMGKAKNEKGEEFFIYPASCDLDECFCWATAEKEKRS